MYNKEQIVNERIRKIEIGKYRFHTEEYGRDQFVIILLEHVPSKLISFKKYEPVYFESKQFFYIDFINKSNEETIDALMGIISKYEKRSVARNCHTCDKFKSKDNTVCKIFFYSFEKDPCNFGCTKWKLNNG